MKDTPGTVYLLHLSAPYRHARHYVGWTTLPLEQRLRLHRTARGAKLLQAAAAAGITWEVARTWPGGTPALELKLKRQGGHARKCPICTPHRRFKT